MSIIVKMMTAIRGVGREAAEDFVDANGLRIFEQEIVDCERGIVEAKFNLSQVVAQRLKIEREKSILEENHSLREDQAKQALSDHKEDIALELSELIAEQEHRLDGYSSSIQRLKDHEEKLHDILKKAVTQIKEYKHELIMAKATDSAQQASTLLSSRTNKIGSKVIDMQESLARIKARQENFEDTDLAWGMIEDQFSKRSLDEKLQDAGISSSESKASEVLLRLKSEVKN